MRQRRLPLAVYPVAVGLMIMSGQALGQTSPFQPTYEEGTVRRGQDYRSFHPIAPSALYCQQACLTEAQCRAWSYEPPTVRGDKQPMCWLKGSVPPAAKAQGYASGVVRPDVNEAAAALPGDKTNAPAPDGAVKAIFEKYNLLGVFAQDCSKPAKAIDNWYYVNRLIDANHVQRDLMGGPTTVTWVSMLDDARELRPNEIAVSGTREGKPASGVWRLDGNRMVQLSARFGDQQLVSDGKWVKTGAAMPWINRCDNAQPAGVDRAAKASSAGTAPPAPSGATAATAPQGRSLACTVASGREERCTGHARYDGQRREWPVAIDVTVPPSNGEVSTRIVPETTKSGLQIHATEIDYRSNPGFVGQDSFTYRRHSDDPSDPFNGTVTMTVTVK
jgi:hypothetical protein